jgi:Ca-activated chloride channel family protein
MTTPRLILTPRKSALLANHDNVLDVLVQIQAPELPAEQRPQRPPLQIALVLDRSGSMAGQPLREAKRCAEFVIEGLGADDRASLVAYDDRVDTLVEAHDLQDRGRLQRAIRSIQSRGTTDLHGGWLRGAETLKPGAGDSSLSRVILLSDGCANRGITDTLTIAEQCQAMAAGGVSTSTYGLGHHFNEDLMVEMARSGQGNSYYGQTADDLMDPFREELALLNALYAQSLELEVEALAGVEFEILNAYPPVSQSRWRLPDLAYGAEAWAILRLRLPKSEVERVSSSALADLVTVRALYRDLGGMHLTTDPAGLALPALEAGALQAIAEDPLVKSRVDELEAARIQEAARTAALEGDWNGVERMLEEIRGIGLDNEWIQAIEEELRRLASRRDRALFAKEARYSSRRMTTRLSSQHERHESLASEVPDFLRRKIAQGKSAGRRRSPR